MRLTLLKSRVYAGECYRYSYSISVAPGHDLVKQEYVVKNKRQQKKVMVGSWVSVKIHQILKTRWVMYLKAKRL